MKLALVGPTYPYRGGIAHYTTLLFQNLNAQGHDVYLYAFKRLYPDWLFPGRSDRDPSTLTLDVACDYMLDTLNPLSWWLTAQAIIQQRPDVLLLQWWVPFFAPLWIVLAQMVRRQKIKVIFICHNVLPHEQQFWHSWVAKWILGLGEGYIVQSQAEAKRLLALLPGRSVKVVPIPVFDMFAGYTVPQAVARRQLNVAPTAKVLLFFGLVRPYKGLRYLLEALPKILESLPDAHLLIVGEFWQGKQGYLKQIEQLAIQDHVSIVDRYVSNEELPLYFSAANVAVLPYQEVTQSAVVQLAFGFKLPVITTRIGGLVEVVAHEETGLLVPAADSDALARAVNHFFGSNLEVQMRRNLETGREVTSWAKLVYTIESLSAC